MWPHIYIYLYITFEGTCIFIPRYEGISHILLYYHITFSTYTIKRDCTHTNKNASSVATIYFNPRFFARECRSCFRSFFFLSYFF